jgi:hypothetical protein
MVLSTYSKISASRSDTNSYDENLMVQEKQDYELRIASWRPEAPTVSEITRQGEQSEGAI